MPKLSVIIPCYFNEGNIPLTTKRLIENEKEFPIGTELEYVFIDDGSKDETYIRLTDFQNTYPSKVKLIKLAANVGSYNAILAGMNYVSGDCCVVLAADLQDPPELIIKMYQYWLSGTKLVIANREKREDPAFQGLFSNTTHYLTRKFAIKNFPKGGFDLVLFDRKLNNQIVQINEKNTNTLSLLLWLGYDYVTIPYIRQKREVGKSRWTTSKKIKLFIDTFVSFSFFPIRVITVSGIFFALIAFLYGIFIVVAKITGFIEVQGWAALMAVILFVSSFQMLALGVLGEYLWRTLDASRGRPNFIVDKFVNSKD